MAVQSSLMLKTTLDPIKKALKRRKMGVMNLFVINILGILTTPLEEHYCLIFLDIQIIIIMASICKSWLIKRVENIWEPIVFKY